MHEATCRRKKYAVVTPWQFGGNEYRLKFLPVEYLFFSFLLVEGHDVVTQI